MSQADTPHTIPPASPPSVNCLTPPDPDRVTSKKLWETLEGARDHLRTVCAIAGLLGNLSTGDGPIEPAHLNPLAEALDEAGLELWRIQRQAEGMARQVEARS